MFDRTKNLTKEIWWFLLLSGVASIIFGFVALLWPGLTLVSLVYTYSIFVLVLGLIELFEAISNIKKDRLWWLLVLLALVNIGIGVFLLRNPLVAATLFVILLAVYIFAQSIFDLIVASYAGKDDHKWLWIVTGLSGLVAGFLVVFYPVAASLAFVWVLGFYTLVHGVISVAFALRIRDELKVLRKK